MKKKTLAILCGFFAPLVCNASNEGVPSWYAEDAPINANRAAFPMYQENGYTNYVGNTGKRQIVSTNSYSYQVPSNRYIPQMPRGTMTVNGVATPVADYNTIFYGGYSHRFADFQFKTGVNSILEWDDMIFSELTVGMKHIFDIHGFDLAAYGEYRQGKLLGGGLSMDYDLEPYDYAYPMDGIFTISMGDQSGKTNRLKVGLSAHHIWNLGGWKISPHIGYEIFKHDLQMSNHIYPNPGVYLPLMTSTGDYVFGDVEGNYYAVGQDVDIADDSGLYQICMSPEDIKVVYMTSDSGGFAPLGDELVTVDYDAATMGTLPWGVDAGECVVIGGDGMVKVDGTTHIYNTTWSGFYLGLEFEKQMTLADTLRFYFQVSMPKYSSEGIWPNRDDWQQNPSFLDEGDNGAFSYEAEMEYSYQLSDRMALSLKADTNYFHVGNIPGELYVAETQVYTEDPANPGSFIIETIPAYTEIVPESLKEATWQSFSVYVGLKYAF